MTQRFHVGDVVRIVEAGPSCGKTTTLTKVEFKWGAWHYVGISPTCGSDGLWYDKHLEKVESVPFKLERGDKVVNRKTGREGFVTRDLTVMTEHDYYHTRLKDLRPQDKVPASVIEEYEEHYPGTYDLIKKDAPW